MYSESAAALHFTLYLGLRQFEEFMLMRLTQHMAYLIFTTTITTPTN